MKNEFVKKCGNCGHLLYTKPKGMKRGVEAEKHKQEYAYLEELYAGNCELTGKHMSGALIAGCFYWKGRNIKKEDN
jgi:hypothetical protein